MDALTQNLAQLLVPDSQIIRQAESRINETLRKPECLGEFCYVLNSCDRQEVRHVAYVLLRRAVNNHWTVASTQASNALLTCLQRRLHLETEVSLLLAVGYVLADIEAVHAGDDSNIGSMIISLAHGAERDRAAALTLIRACGERECNCLRGVLDRLVDFFLVSFNDSNLNLLSLSAVAVCFRVFGNEATVLKFQRLIPVMVTVCRTCAQNGREDVFLTACEAFESLLSSPVPVIRGSLTHILDTLLVVISTVEMEDATRLRALSILQEAVLRFAKQFVKLNLLGHVLDVLLGALKNPVVAAEPLDDGASVFMGIVEALETVCSHFASSRTFSSLFGAVHAWFRPNSSPSDRRAGIAISGVIGEYSTEQAVAHIDELVKLLASCLKDPESIVREQACICLVSFAENLCPDLIRYAQELISCLLHVFGVGELHSKRRAAFSLGVLLENLDERNLVFADDLMKTLLGLLSTEPIELKELIVLDISSLAVALKKHFLPYASKIIPMMHEPLSLTADHLHGLRARFTEAAGSIILAVGEEGVSLPDIVSISSGVLSGFGMDSSELRQSGFSFFAKVAEALGPHFEFLSRSVFEAVEASLNQDLGVNRKETNSVNEPSPLLAFNNEQKNDPARDVYSSISTDALAERVASLGFLSSVGKHCGALAAPHYPRLRSRLFDLLSFPHRLVRVEAVSALVGMAMSLSGSETSTRIQVGNEIFGNVVEFLQQEPDKEVAASSITCLAETLSGFSGLLSEKTVSMLVSFVKSVLCSRAFCQTAAVQDGVQDEDFEEDEDILTGSLIDSALEWVNAMAQWTPDLMMKHLWRDLQPVVISLTKPSRGDDIAALAVGCLAEVVRHIGTPVVPYLGKVLPVLEQALRSSDEIVVRNAAYGLGFCIPLVAATSPSIAQESLALLKQATTSDACTHVVRDNIAASAARILSMVGNQEWFPQHVDWFLSLLPVKEDGEEADTVYMFLLNLLDGYADKMPNIVHTFGQIAPYILSLDPHAENRPSDEVFRGLDTAFKFFAQQYPSSPA